MKLWRCIFAFVLAVGMCVPASAWGALPSSEVPEGVEGATEQSADSRVIDEELAGSESLEIEVDEGAEESVEETQGVSSAVDGAGASGEEADAAEATDAVEPAAADEAVAAEDGVAAGDALGDAEDSSDVELLSADLADVPSVAMLAMGSSSGLVVDVAGGSAASGVKLQAYSSNQTVAQRFQIESVGDGYYRITNVGSGLVVDVANGEAASGAAIQQYAWNGTDAQLWRLVSTNDGDGSCYLVSKLDERLAVGTASSSATLAGALCLAALDGDNAQEFYLNEPSATVADGSYVVETRAASTVLDVSGGSWDDHANIQMYSANSTAAQTFEFSYDEKTGYYVIGTHATGKVLDVADGSTSSGANVQQYTYNGTAAQLWIVEGSSSAGYTIRCAGGGMALDVFGASTASGANVQVYDPNGTDAQIWVLTEAAAAVIEAGLYTISSAVNPSYVLDIDGGSLVDGANAQLYASNGTWAQKFQIEVREDGACVIRSLMSGKVLDVDGAGTASGTNVQQYTYNGSDAQLWEPVCVGEGEYMFRSKCNGLMLDVLGGSAANGANVQVYTANGTNAQKFSIEPTDTSASISEGAYVVKSLVDGKVLDIAAASESDGAAAQLYESNGTYAQKFKITSGGEGSHYLLNIHSGKSFDVDTGSRTYLQQWETTYGASQTWVFYPVDSSLSAYYIQSAYTGEYLTNSNGSLVLSAYAGSDAQKFVFEETDAFKIYLDAGHGYNSNGTGVIDPGACSLGYQEYELTAELVDLIADELDDRGIEYCIGYGEAYWDRQQDAEDKGCTTFLSIHFNAGGGTGTESYIHSYNAHAGSATYQSILHPYLVAGTGLYDRGQKEAALAVCSWRMPAILCEIAFIDTSTDMATYVSRKKTVATFLAAGIEEASKNDACVAY